MFEGLVDPGRRGKDGIVTPAGTHFVVPLMLWARLEKGVSSGSAAVVEHLDRFDNLAHYTAVALVS